MIVPVSLFLVSLAAVTLALVVPGWSDALLIAAPAALGSFLLLLRAALAQRARRRRTGQDWIILDGSNIMYWRDNSPSVPPLEAAIAALTARGMTPGVVFDANAGYLLFGRHLNDRGFAEALGLALDRVMVVPKGTPADPYILTAARDLGARIVTNDRYRDWAGEYPELTTPGHLIRGGYRDGRLWLEIEPQQRQTF